MVWMVEDYNRKWKILYDDKSYLIWSLKAKLRAWVGKYRSTLARFPLQNG